MWKRKEEEKKKKKKKKEKKSRWISLIRRFPKKATKDSAFFFFFFLSFFLSFFQHFFVNVFYFFSGQGGQACCRSSLFFLSIFCFLIINDVGKTQEVFLTPHIHTQHEKGWVSLFRVGGFFMSWIFWQSLGLLITI